MGVEEMIIQQAEERGVAKGVEKGVDLGAIQAKTEAAKNMIRKGFDAPFICEMLEVTPEFINKIKQEMKV